MVNSTVGPTNQLVSHKCKKTESQFHLECTRFQRGLHTQSHDTTLIHQSHDTHNSANDRINRWPKLSVERVIYHQNHTARVTSNPAPEHCCCLSPEPIPRFRPTPITGMERRLEVQLITVFGIKLNFFVGTGIWYGYIWCYHIINWHGGQSVLDIRGSVCHHVKRVWPLDVILGGLNVETLRLSSDGCRQDASLGDVGRYSWICLSCCACMCRISLGTPNMSKKFFLESKCLKMSEIQSENQTVPMNIYKSTWWGHFTADPQPPQ